MREIGRAGLIRRSKRGNRTGVYREGETAKHIGTLKYEDFPYIAQEGEGVSEPYVLEVGERIATLAEDKNGKKRLEHFLVVSV